MMERVTGIGGVFFKANDPKALTDWYRTHLGVPVDADGYVAFPWRKETDRERLGKTLRQEGVEVDPRIEEGNTGALPGSWTPRETASSSGSRRLVRREETVRR